MAFSSLAAEAIIHGKTMGLKVYFTDHSLFGFADASSILTNKLLKFTLSDIDHVICVSNTSKENTVLRAVLNPNNVSVIPNALVASQLLPDPSKRNPDYITIVVLSRLVYRKGMDLLVAVIPRLCAYHPRLRFIIGGDGPKRIDLEQMREKYFLYDRVELVGAVRHSQVRNILVKGDIFLNTSLTEAFCIGIVEAACCGLLVVSTKVGGVPEVLPEEMILFAKPDEDDIVNVVSEAIDIIESKELDTTAFHEQVKKMYSWEDIAARTEIVYKKDSPNFKLPLIERLRRYYGCGLWYGKLLCLVMILDWILLFILEYFYPLESIDKAEFFDAKTLNDDNFEQGDNL
ncbi:Glycosyl transferase, family 1 domain-containing protein [Rozella allomycis CSF55]|uniref:Glycosyl transferase, family 1 domain-containing protein n=1 Tax=Rozella allomycis (strain CSF55) TaxID=988480 RepID=A0A075B2N2_ROZAC|nr:Glycosyl transferase, family 1 domain-containing protein [Rozella allomycis CSF55]|eukprot:EPZ36860.1 Glycosyl transferase, family 1 domain-containing protein [Rozella allomycis CSF55]